MSFDTAAPSYDQQFTRLPLAAWLRGRTWAQLDTHLQPGMRVLELGGGTGEDALHLLRRGVEVLLTDASPAMLEVARQKAAQAGFQLSTQVLDFNRPATWQLSGPFDAAYSNFGALNCTPRWAELAAWLAGLLAPGAYLGIGMMGRFCLWETLWHAAHLDFATATRRWRGWGEANLPATAPFPIWYATARSLLRAFAPYFRAINWFGLGVFLPPSDAFDVLESRIWLRDYCLCLENALAAREPFRRWGDHFWLNMQRSQADFTGRP